MIHKKLNGSKCEKESNLVLIFENGGQILILSKMVTTSWKITKKTEENI